MGKKNSKPKPEAEAPENLDEDTVEAQAEQIVAEADRIRIRVNVAVNGHRAGDTLRVDRDHPFYGALLSQNLAEQIGEED